MKTIMNLISLLNSLSKYSTEMNVLFHLVESLQFDNCDLVDYNNRIEAIGRLSIRSSDRLVMSFCSYTQHELKDLIVKYFPIEEEL
jgi:hypothetical protein